MNTNLAIIVAGAIAQIVLVSIILVSIRMRKPKNTPKQKLAAAEKVLAAAGLSCEMASKEEAAKSCLGDNVLILKQFGGVICGKQPMIPTESVEEWSLSLVRWIANYKYSAGFKDAKRTKNV